MLKKTFLILALLYSFPAVVDAQLSFNWIDKEKNDWTNGASWDLGDEPSEGANVFISNRISFVTLGTNTETIKDLVIGNGDLEQFNGVLSSHDGLIKIGCDGDSAAYRLDTSECFATQSAPGGQHVIIGQGDKSAGTIGMAFCALFESSGNVEIGTDGGRGYLVMQVDCSFITGGSLQFGNGSILVSDHCNLSVNDQFSIDGVGGVAELRICQSSDVQVGGALNVGRHANVQSLVRMDGPGSSVSVDDLRVGDDALSTSVFQWTGFPVGGDPNDVVSKITSRDNTEFGPGSSILTVNLLDMINFDEIGPIGTLPSREIVLIDNVNAISGTFTGVPEGASVPIGGSKRGTISYVGGSDGNDLTITLWGIPEITFTALPTSIDVTIGSLYAGGVPEISASDNSDLSIRRLNASLNSETAFEVSSTSPVGNPTSIEVTLEGSVFARREVIQSIELYDYAANTWESVASSQARAFVDKTITAQATGDLSRFVEKGTSAIKARIRHISTIQRQVFTTHTDSFEWSFQE